MNNIDKQYQQLLKDIIEYGVEKQDRTGTGTKSIFGYTIRHNMKDGFPLLTTKKMAWKTMVTELLWFLRGDTNIKFLVDNGCNIWNGDAYKNYLKQYEKDKKHGVKYEDNPENDRPFDQEEFINWIKNVDEFAKIYGDLGPIYGKQWRKWGTREWVHLSATDERPEMDALIPAYIDQIANLINDLKTNPDSRRLMVNAWNVGELDQMVLPPCHYGFQVYTRELSLEERHQLALPIWKEKYGPLADMMVPTNVDNTPYKIPTRAISLMWNQRSVDTGLGWSFNIASYSLLLIMLAKQVNMIPDEIICNLGDVHLYSNHIEPIKEQLGREPFPLPNVTLSDRIVNDISEYTLEDIRLENYQSHPTIKLPLSN